MCSIRLHTSEQVRYEHDDVFWIIESAVVRGGYVATTASRLCQENVLILCGLHHARSSPVATPALLPRHNRTRTPTTPTTLSSLVLVVGSTAATVAVLVFVAIQTLFITMRIIECIIVEPCTCN